MIPILVGIAIVILEIIFDKISWTKGIDDKPISTIMRFVLMVIISVVIFIESDLDWIFALTSFAVIFTTHFALFDFVLNVVRWENLPDPWYWPYGTKYRELQKQGYTIEEAEAAAYALLSTWQKIVYRVSKFTKRFFWHGDGQTKSIYDKAFQRIPPLMELMIKGILFWIAWYYHF